MRKKKAHLAKFVPEGRESTNEAGNQRSSSVYGYDSYSDEKGERKLIPNKNEAEVVRTVCKLYTTKWLSFKKIADYLNAEGVPQKRHGKKWRQSHIALILRRPEYAGLSWDSEHKNLLAAETVPPLLSMSKEEWLALQEKISKSATRRNRGGTRMSQHPLSGIMRCGVCGAHYYFRHNSRLKQTHYHHHVGTSGAKGCYNQPKYIPAAFAERLFARTVDFVLMIDKETIAYVEIKKRSTQENAKAVLIEKEALEKQKELLEREFGNLYRHVEKYGSDEVVEKRILEKRAQFHDLDAKVAALKQKLEREQEEYKLAVQSYQPGTLSEFNKADGAKRREIYSNILQEATVKNNTIALSYKNGKSFRILKAARKAFKMETYYRGKLQASVFLDSKGDSMRNETRLGSNSRSGKR